MRARVEVSMVWITALMWLGLGGCASQPDDATQAQKPALTVEEVLATTMGEEDYGETRRCLPNHLVERAEILDDKHILFWGRRDRAWLNTLSMKCIGLRKRDPLRFELHSSQLCHLDTVSSFDNSMSGAIRQSARCSLGEFRAMDHAQAELLTQELGR